MRISYSLLGSKVGNDNLCQEGVIGSMSAQALLLLSYCVQPLQGIVSYDFQHGEARYVICQYLHLNEAGIDQSGQSQDGFFLNNLTLIPANCLCSFERPSSHKDAKGSK